MALTTMESQLAVKQQVNTFVGLTPAAQLELKAFWMWAAQHLRGKKLDFLPFADMTTDAVYEDAACKLYVVYAKKQATATDAFLKVFDDATNDATAGDAMLCIPLTTASEYALYIAPNGFVLATGLVAGSYTALIGSNGSTPTTSGDGPNGFFIVGNA